MGDSVVDIRVSTRENMQPTHSRVDKVRMLVVAHYVLSAPDPVGREVAS